MALAPSQPAIGITDQYLPKVDRLARDPCNCESHSGSDAPHRPPSFASLLQWRFDEWLYADRTNVATRQQDIFASRHKVTIKSPIFRFLLRYPASCTSKPIRKLVLQTIKSVIPTSISVGVRRCIWEALSPLIATVSITPIDLRKYLRGDYIQVFQLPLQHEKRVNRHPYAQCKRPELPGLHTSLRWLLCDRCLGIPGRVGFLHAIRVGSQRDSHPDDSESPAIAVHLLALRIRQGGLLTHAAAQHNYTRDYSVKSDFHCDSPRNWAELNRRPLFLAESHFTSRTPHRSNRGALLRCGWRS